MDVGAATAMIESGVAGATAVGVAIFGVLGVVAAVKAIKRVF
jgi:hypothetical protein